MRVQIMAKVFDTSKCSLKQTNASGFAVRIGIIPIKLIGFSNTCPKVARMTAPTPTYQMQSLKSVRNKNRNKFWF
jgi:hypothetical protein